jgi:hypothetical protein
LAETSDVPLAHWLLIGGPAARDLRTAFQELIERLEDEGTQLLRAALNVDMLHPEMLAAMYTWQGGNQLRHTTRDSSLLIAGC